MEILDPQGLLDAEPMNIYAKKGHKVVYANAGAGYTRDQETAKKYLELGKIYTVLYTDVGNWHTDVYLEEVPDVAFNSVMFDNLYRE